MKKIKLELKWGFIITIMFLVWMLVEKVLGWHDEKIADHYWLTFLFTPFIIIMYTLAIREKRRRFLGGVLTWIQGFTTGVKVSIFAALLSPLAQYIIHNYITPKYFDNVIAYSVTNQLMTIEAANDYFNINSYMLQSAVGTLVTGIIVSAVVAFFLKRDTPKVKKQSVSQ